MLNDKAFEIAIQLDFWLKDYWFGMGLMIPGKKKRGVILLPTGNHYINHNGFVSIKPRSEYRPLSMDERMYLVQRHDGGCVALKNAVLNGFSNIGAIDPDRTTSSYTMEELVQLHYKLDAVIASCTDYTPKIKVSLIEADAMERINAMSEVLRTASNGYYTCDDFTVEQYGEHVHIYHNALPRDILVVKPNGEIVTRTEINARGRSLITGDIEEPQPFNYMFGTPVEMKLKTKQNKEIYNNIIYSEERIFELYKAIQNINQVLSSIRLESINVPAERRPDIEKYHHVKITGLTHGYPNCCINYYIEKKGLEESDKFIPCLLHSNLPADKLERIINYHRDPDFEDFKVE